MVFMNAFEERIDRAYKEELVHRIGQAVPDDGVRTPIPGLDLYRFSRPTERVHGVSKLSLCIIAQGAKEVYLGDKSYPYDADRYLLATVELPVTGQVVEATPERPYLALRLELDPALVGSVMVEAGLPVPRGHEGAKALVVSRLDSGLRDVTVRLLRLLDSPGAARVLLPMIKREIVFRLLTGEQGSRLRHLPEHGDNSNRIAQAIQKLRRELDRPVSVEGLAKELGMSPSGFHHHFKAVTDMSPLQFQKQIRLQEARRLMLSENLDAGSAGYRVGYDDASYFSRDYKKHFGHSPYRDAERLRALLRPSSLLADQSD
jgi:AraC-like DNA-binding protein